MYCESNRPSHYANITSPLGQLLGALVWEHWELPQLAQDTSSWEFLLPDATSVPEDPTGPPGRIRSVCNRALLVSLSGAEAEKGPGAAARQNSQSCAGGIKHKPCAEKAHFTFVTYSLFLNAIHMYITDRMTLESAIVKRVAQCRRS